MRSSSTARSLLTLDPSPRLRGSRAGPAEAALLRATQIPLPTALPAKQRQSSKSHPERCAPRPSPPAAGLYNICYLNGFQVQPGEDGSWDADLLLRDANGKPVIDKDWNETLLDVSTDAKRTRIAAVVGGWITGCAKDGFAAIEIDNLDSYSRSGGRLTQDNAVAFLKLLSQRAHAAGLAIAQKNSTELLSRRTEMGTDFAVAEQCSQYSECADYVSAYGTHVLMIEYQSSDFKGGCAAYGATHSIVLRDVDLVPKGQSGYVFDGC
jgi:hypothetical protein